MSHDHHHDSCCNSSCQCPCHHHHEEDCHQHESGSFADQLLHLADEAWMEVLKEKIKKDIETKEGSQLDELAKLITQSNHQRWIAKMEEKKTGTEFQSQLQSLMHQECKDGSCKR